MIQAGGLIWPDKFGLWSGGPKNHVGVQTWCRQCGRAYMVYHKSGPMGSNHAHMSTRPPNVAGSVCHVGSQAKARQQRAEAEPAGGPKSPPQIMMDQCGGEQQVFRAITSPLGSPSRGGVPTLVPAHYSALAPPATQSLDDDEEIHECDYNTSQEPAGLWGQCYEEASMEIDGEYYCTFHGFWVFHNRRCSVVGCGNGITYERYCKWALPRGGDDCVPCRRCEKRGWQ